MKKKLFIASAILTISLGSVGISAESVANVANNGGSNVARDVGDSINSAAKTFFNGADQFASNANDAVRNAAKNNPVGSYEAEGMNDKNDGSGTFAGNTGINNASKANSNRTGNGLANVGANGANNVDLNDPSSQIPQLNQADSNYSTTTQTAYGQARNFNAANPGTAVDIPNVAFAAAAAATGVALALNGKRKL